MIFDFTHPANTSVDRAEEGIPLRFQVLTFFGVFSGYPAPQPASALEQGIPTSYVT
jgi:hypothetical protein